MLRKITKIILDDKINDIKKVYLVISYDNVLSQMVAKRSNFIEDGLSDEQHYIQGYIEYPKTKEML